MRGGWSLWLALIAAGLLLFLRSATVPVIDPDEARFARTTVEMVRTGDWVVPHFEGKPRLAKPPLLHWVQSLLVMGLGEREWVYRLPSIAATLATLGMLAWLVRKRLGEEPAVWAVVCLATMPLVLVLGKTGTIDAMLSGLVFGTVAIDLAWLEETRRWRGSVTGLLLGLAFLTKGPIGVILALGAILAGRLAVRRPVWPGIVALLSGVAVFLAVVLAWGVPLLHRLGINGVDAILKKEFVERALVGTDHVAPFWYYLPVIFLGCLPWAGPLALGIIRAIRRRRDPAARLPLYATAGFLAGIVILSLGKGKLPGYILPLLSLAALVSAWELREEVAGGRGRLGALLLAVTQVVFPACLVIFASIRPEREAVRAALWGSAPFVFGAAIAFWAAWRRRPRWAWGGAALATSVFLLLLVLRFYPYLGKTRSMAPIVVDVPALRSGRPCVVVNMRVPSLTFYLDRVPEETIPREEMPARLGREDRPLFVLSERDWNRLDPSVRERLRTLGQAGSHLIAEERD